SVYASSKAAVSCFTEALAHQLAATGGDVRAAVFYPSGGLLETGLWTAQRNRPPELARTRERAPAPGTTFEEFKQQLAAAGRPTDTVDLTELGRFLIQGIKDGKFVISYGLEEAADLLPARADGIVAEILFPNTVPPFFDESGLVALPPTEADYDRRWAGLQAHNRWMADFCAAAPGRRAACVQVFVNRIDDALAEIRWAKDNM